MSKNIIGFQGIDGANSHLACREFYPNYTCKSFESFHEIFSAVESGSVDIGLIPLENSYAGRVFEIHNLLQNSNVFIVAEHFFFVQHNLAVVVDAKLEDIKEVYSHPQALWQCKKNLELLKLKTVDFSNTAKASEFVAKSQDKTKAVICSKLAAEIYGLKIIKENIQDCQSDNLTIFAAISSKIAIVSDLSLPTITTILFTVKNISGSLYDALGCFARRNIDMIKLESYIPGGSSTEAKFFIAIYGHPNEDRMKEAFLELNNFTKDYKLLGVYHADRNRKIINKIN